jgi:hypothetical protein
VVGVIAWIVTTFSLAPLVTTFYPNVTLKQTFSAFIVCAVIGVVFVAALLWYRSSRRADSEPDPTENRRPKGMPRAEWREVLRERRTAWVTPAVDTLERPAMSMARRIGLLTLRGYIIFAIVIMVIKLI